MSGRRFAPWLGGLLLVVLLVLAAGVPTRADPFHHGAPSASGSASTSAGVAFGGGFVAWLAESQHHLNDAISDAFRDAENKNSRAALALVLGLAFLYGMLHAIGPGHGKSVVASYFVAHHARWTGGILMGSMISLIQGASAIVLVGLLSILLRAKQLEVLDRSAVVEFVSYGLIVAIGVFMFYRAATGQLHAHDHDDHGHDGHHHPPRAAARLDRRLIVATGLTPCASAIIILLFALANNAFGLGVVAVAVLTVGMAVTISTIGVLTVLGRRALLRLVDRVGVQTHRLERGLAMAAATVIVGVSGLMMYDVWTRL